MNFNADLKIKPSTPRAFDLLCLGEVMLRLDPGANRIRNARSFQAWEGGGEYNVARGLRKTFGLRTGVVTALVDNEIGRLVEDLIMQGGVDSSLILWREDNGKCRNGLNFTERGFGLRGPIGVSDRSFTAVSQLGESDIDWKSIFDDTPIRWLHTGGVFAGLSPTTHRCASRAIRLALEHETIVSYDINFRPGIWKRWGTPEDVQKISKLLVEQVHVLFGSREDFETALGISVVPPLDGDMAIGSFYDLAEATAKKFPNLKVIGMSHRKIHSASCHSWQCFLWHNHKVFESKVYDRMDIFDRIGSGDSFVAGVIYGLLSSGIHPNALQKSIDLGAAHGALAMTTPGDNSMSQLPEIERLIKGDVPRILR